MIALATIAAVLLGDAHCFLVLLFRQKRTLIAENLFLRRQLALLPGTGCQAAPDRSWNAGQPCFAGKAVRLAFRPGRSTPIKQLREEGKTRASRGIDASGLDASLFVKRQLTAQKEVLRLQQVLRPDQKRD